MKLTIAGAEYSVRFRHFTPMEYETVMQDPLPNGCKAVTLCRIHTSEDEPVAFGLAMCSKKDNISPKMGRKVSFGRALVAMGVEKTERHSLVRKV